MSKISNQFAAMLRTAVAQVDEICQTRCSLLNSKDNAFIKFNIDTEVLYVW